jgi:hypothetical protein
MNLTHIQSFISRLKKAQATNQRTIQLTMAEASALHADITSLLIAQQQRQEERALPAQLDLSGGEF